MFKQYRQTQKEAVSLSAQGYAVQMPTFRTSQRIGCQVAWRPPGARGVGAGGKVCAHLLNILGNMLQAQLALLPAAPGEHGSICSQSPRCAFRLPPPTLS